jgi:chemotaxis signal transduction protein
MEERNLGCFLFPTEELFIVLPQAAVVEIVQQPELSDERGPSAWFKGKFVWRSQHVALVSLEEMCALQTRRQATGSLIAVLHVLREDTDMPFYAFQLGGIPRSVSLGPNSLIEATDREINCDYISSESLIEGYRVVIPNLKRIEREIQQQVEGSVRV